MPAQPQTKVTIALTRYDEPNWLVLEALESLARQREVNAQVLFLDQKEEPAYWHQVSQLSSRWIRFEPIHIPSKSLLPSQIDCNSAAYSSIGHNLRYDLVEILDSDVQFSGVLPPHNN